MFLQQCRQRIEPQNCNREVKILDPIYPIVYKCISTHNIMFEHHNLFITLPYEILEKVEINYNECSTV